MNKVDLGEAFGASTGGMDVVSAKIAAPFQGLVDWEVCQILVTESHDLALGDVQRQLILARVGELGELDAPDLGADGGCQLGGFGHALG